MCTASLRPWWGKAAGCACRCPAWTMHRSALWGIQIVYAASCSTCTQMQASPPSMFQLRESALRWLRLLLPSLHNVLQCTMGDPDWLRGILLHLHTDAGRSP